jgi:hypothetical protein
MTVAELLNRLREIQDQLDDMKLPDSAELFDIQDLVYRLIQDVDDLDDGHNVDPWTVSEPI